MALRGILLASVVVVATVGSGVASAEDESKELKDLVIRLKLTDRGIGAWRERLGVSPGGPAAERLMIVNESGDILAERSGGASLVVIDRELDHLLRDAGRRVVMVHNHPSSVGLSAADIGHLAKPGVLAILALGHDGSVFVASAGEAMDPDVLEATQYVRALQEVKRRLRVEWPSSSASVAASDVQLNHLVARALAQAGVIRYWAELRGSNRDTYEGGRPAFSRVVAGAAAYLRRVENPALANRR